MNQYMEIAKQNAEKGIKKGNHNDLIHMKKMDREECLETFKKYKETGGIIY